MTTVLAHVGGPVLAPLQLAPATVAGVLYVVRAHRLRRTARAVPGWRQACFHAGLVVMVLALASPLGHVSEELFAAHMAEHLLLGDVAALLLVLGLTGPLLAPVLRSPLLHGLRALSHPVTAFGLWALNLYLWHVPSLHEAAVEHAGVHALQHAGFILFGANVWLALLGPLPKPAWFGHAAQLVYIVGVRLVGAVLANVFLFGGGAFYDVYARGEASFSVAPGADQSAAGAIMMVWESFLTIGLLCWLFLKVAREADERQELLDLAAAEGVELSAERAARAVAAGRGPELRRRLSLGSPGKG